VLCSVSAPQIYYITKKGEQNSFMPFCALSETKGMVIKMYFKEDKQISLFEFGQAAGFKLDPENRCIKISEII